MTTARILVPSRIRTHEGSFAFIPHRFLRGGVYASCSSVELILYLLLVLAADRWGMSFYSRETVSRLVRFPLERIEAAFESLAAKDLIACEGALTQVLSLAPEPVKRIAKPKVQEAKEQKEEFDVSKAIKEFLVQKGWDK